MKNGKRSIHTFLVTIFTSSMVLVACSMNATPDDSDNGKGAAADTPAVYEKAQSTEAIESKPAALGCVYQCCDFRKKQECCPGQPCGPCHLATNNCQ